jgi:hypothetical protein
MPGIAVWQRGYRMDGEKWMIAGGMLLAVIVIEWLRSHAFQNGRPAGRR